MLTRRLVTLGLVGLGAGILACGVASRLAGQAPVTPEPVAGQLPATSSPADIHLHLKPDPITVKVTQDPTRTAKTIALPGVAMTGFGQVDDSNGAHS